MTDIVSNLRKAHEYALAQLPPDLQPTESEKHDTIWNNAANEIERLRAIHGQIRKLIGSLELALVNCAELSFDRLDENHLQRQGDKFPWELVVLVSKIEGPQLLLTLKAARSAIKQSKP